MGRTQDALSSGNSPWLTLLFLPVSSHQSTPWGMAFTAMTPGAEFKGTSAVKVNPPASAMGAVVLSTSTPAASMSTILIRASSPYRGSHLASAAETVTESPGFTEEGLTVCSGGKQGGAPPTEAPQPAEAKVANIAADSSRAARGSRRRVRRAEELMHPLLPCRTIGVPDSHE